MYEVIFRRDDRVLKRVMRETLERAERTAFELGIRLSTDGPLDITMDDGSGEKLYRHVCFVPAE